MNLETVFSIVSALALFSWIALFIFYPSQIVYKVLFSGTLLLLSLTYLYFIILGMGAESEGGFGTLAEVKALLSSDEALLAGWIHYLAFDLFVGMWIAHDSWKLDINRWVLLPCLLLTFMLGPVGLLTYFILRGIKSHNIIQSPH
ncbi:Putative integral membrane protein [Indibacter alkaliphilus LW1]|jgi:hypothetical protein|uniref:Integral membrane protein n=1 Tax=Indibacter alkaliphilus (strain CCUG 57479 / KCTC 22604 / LW1) TaxID=1189612 RepID=S2DVM0_INDAL|nr:ABA4-like family protein [Indibacter alkaliphilus]EOZ96091.1 Putative integral membrane protein [Indibacter alkaliphilus LW1]